MPWSYFSRCDSESVNCNIDTKKLTIDVSTQINTIINCQPLYHEPNFKSKLDHEKVSIYFWIGVFSEIKCPVMLWLDSIRWEVKHFREFSRLWIINREVKIIILARFYGKYCKQSLQFNLCQMAAGVIGTDSPDFLIVFPFLGIEVFWGSDRYFYQLITASTLS